MNKVRKGILFAFLTSILSGLAIFFSKISLAKIDPLVLTTGRNLYVGILFLLIFLTRGRLVEIKKLKPQQLFLLLLIGLIGGWLPFYLFFTGLKLTQAVTANIIHKTLFIWVTILALIFLKEKINRNFIIGFFLVIFANFYFANFKFVFGKGEMMVLAATILWSIENIIAKKVLKSVSSELVGLFRMGAGGGLLMLTALITNPTSLFELRGTGNTAIIIIGGTILFFYVFTWYKALKYAPASLVTLILTFSVVVGNILNGAFTGIKIVPKDLYSSIFISLAMFTIIYGFSRFATLRKVFFRS